MKLLKKALILSILLVILFTNLAVAKELSLTSPIRHSYPFLYWDGSQLKGMHIDIVRDALKNLGYDLEIEGLPLKRCLRQTNKGEADGIISLPYDTNYTQLSFPPDAGEVAESNWRIMQVDNVVVTYESDNYEFDGDVDSLPSPVRIIHGQNILEKKLSGIDARIEKVKTNVQNFKKLMRDEKGVLITTTVTAENMYQDSRFEDMIRIHHRPVTSLSHHLAVAKSSDLTEAEQKNIWDEIAKLRKDYVYMLQLYAQY